MEDADYRRMEAEKMRWKTRRIFYEKSVWIGVAAAVTGMIAGKVMGDGDLWSWRRDAIWNLLSDGMQSRILLFLLPVAAVFAGADLYLREKQSGFLKFSVIRRDKAAYRREKICQIFGSTLWIWGIAVCIVMIVGGVFGENGSEQLGRTEEFWRMCRLFFKVYLISAFVSNVGAICAVLTGSLYLTMGIPFVSYYFLVLLQERYFVEAAWLSPARWIQSEKGSTWLFLIIGIFVTAGAYRILLRRELREID